MITAGGLVLRRQGRAVLAGVDIAVPAGAVTIAVGPNGAGKSTLLKLLSGELRPDAGTIRYGGRDLAAIRVADLARRRAVLPQSGTPTFPLTVLELVRLGARAGGARDPDAAALAALAAVGLAGWSGRMFSRLSGGEQQRAQFARALAQVPVATDAAGPRALFLDEPTSSLDLAQQVAVLEVARGFARRGGAVFAVLHDLNLAAEFADAVVVLRDGAIVEAGPPDRALFERIVSGVYGLPGAACRLPGDAVPYVLPQARAGAGARA